MLSEYRVEVRPLVEELGGGYEALYPQLARGVVGHGETPQEALADLFAATPAFLEAVEESGQVLPPPQVLDDWGDYSGKLEVRIPRMLHATLARLAGEQGVSLNSLVQTILATGAAAAELGRGTRPVDSSPAEKRPPWRNAAERNRYFSRRSRGGTDG